MISRASRIIPVSFVVLVLALAAVPLQAQSPEPAWLVIERADRLAHLGEFGQAIQLYRRALTLDPGSPEAEYGLARVFASVNDYAVARVHYENAVSVQERLRVPAMAFEIHYGLAELFRVQRQFAEYEAELGEILALAPEPEVDADALLRAFEQQGIDRTLVLYRVPEDGATQARGQLAELLVGLGRYESAALQALMAVVQQLTTVIEALLERDPLFAYETVRDAVTAGLVYGEIERYLARTELHKNLYYLAAALLGEGNRTMALETWRLAVDLPHGGVWTRRASIQLADPQPEPLIVDTLP